METAEKVLGRVKVIFNGENKLVTIKGDYDKFECVGVVRNRLILELMARSGMRISEVLGLRPIDIDGQKLLLHTPKSGREQEIFFIPKKLSTRLLIYVRDTSIPLGQ